MNPQERMPGTEAGQYFELYETNEAAMTPAEHQTLAQQFGSEQARTEFLRGLNAETLAERCDWIAEHCVSDGISTRYLAPETEKSSVPGLAETAGTMQLLGGEGEAYRDDIALAVLLREYIIQPHGLKSPQVGAVLFQLLRTGHSGTEHDIDYYERLMTGGLTAVQEAGLEPDVSELAMAYMQGRLANEALDGYIDLLKTGGIQPKHIRVELRGHIPIDIKPMEAAVLVTKPTATGEGVVVPERYQAILTEPQFGLGVMSGYLLHYTVETKLGDESALDHCIEEHQLWSDEGQLVDSVYLMNLERAVSGFVEEGNLADLNVWHKSVKNGFLADALHAISSGRRWNGEGNRPMGASYLAQHMTFDEMISSLRLSVH